MPREIYVSQDLPPGAFVVAGDVTLVGPPGDVLDPSIAANLIANELNGAKAVSRAPNCTHLDPEQA